MVGPDPLLIAFDQDAVGAYWPQSQAGAQSGMIKPDLVPFPLPRQPTDQLDRAVAAYLTRFTGTWRDHTRSDLRSFLSWYAERRLHPLAARRPHLELYIRWMPEVRHFKPSTVSRRFSVVADCGSSKPPAPTSPTWGKNTATACLGCAAKEPRSF
jgi:hypothetical protein